MQGTRHREGRGRRWWELTAVLVGCFIVGFIVCLLVGAGGSTPTQYLDNLTETAAAFSAATACTLAATRHHGRIRLAWALLGASALSWGLGQCVWDWYQLGHNVLIPFPSLADAGYLGAVPLAIAGVLAFPVASERAGSQVRQVLDGLIIVAALLVVSWDTVLGAVFNAGADSTLKMVLSLLYPLSDIAIVTMVLLRVGDVARGARLPLLLVAVGLTCAAVADSSFAYLNALGTYGAGNALDAGWVAGYLLIAVAALRAVSHPMRGALPRRLPSRLGSLLPYPPVAAALGMSIGERVVTGSSSVFTFWAVFAAVGLVLIRQYLVVADNVSLFRNLTSRERELHHQANHDALTGLPNRVAFHEAVVRALARDPRDGRLSAVLFIDLDDFKRINDTMGHGVGDRVLVVVADRIRSSIRPVDVAARLGGDEFAVLVERASDQLQLDAIARRILQALRQPARIEGAILPVCGTIGVAVAEDTGETCDELLRRADVAMYSAKREGKDRVSVYREVAA
ncbi:MAG: GGDEF domain-containing protein [Candidatus Dormibacteraeota bacterium]|nr:GGDEF domain-containing protein [Candidatus Dormibacteraeota bacterium]